MSHRNGTTWLIILMAAAPLLSASESAQFSQLDQAVGSRQLGTVTRGPLGRLVVDGEGACDEFPYSACGYDQGGYLYYYFDGRLISKTFEFGPTTPVGPLGLEARDTASDVISKVSPYLEDRRPVVAGDTLYYAFDCKPNLCRLDIKLESGRLKQIRFYYSDAI